MENFEELDVSLQVFANVFKLANKLQLKMDQRKTDLTGKQWFVLAALNFCPDAPTLKELAVMLDYSHQNTRQIINKLAEKGYVNVVKDKDDQRAIRILLTDKVSEWESMHKEENDAFIGEMYRGISQKELNLLNEIFLKLLTNLSNFNKSKD